MKHKRTTAMLLCGLAMIGALAAIPATSATAYTCLGNPSGDNTGNSNPEAGEYDDNVCPYTEAQLEEQWRNTHSGYDQDSGPVESVDAPDYSIAPLDTTTNGVPPLGLNGALNPLDTESSYESSGLFSNVTAPGASEAAISAAMAAANAAAGGIELNWTNSRLRSHHQRSMTRSTKGFPRSRFVGMTPVLPPTKTDSAWV